MSFSFTCRPPRPYGVRCVLSALLVAAGLAATSCSREPHTIQLRAGDFVQAVVEQKEDVRVELIDPEDREVVHVDGPNGTREPEELAAVAERTGLYELRVLNCPADAPPANCYTLQEPVLVRPATGVDRLRAQAVRADQDATDRMPEGEASWPAQREIREHALTLWRRVGDREREARELVELGIVQRLLFQTQPAAERLHEAARIYAALGDSADEARALNEAGMTCEELGHAEEALKDYRQALAKARQAGDREQEKHSLNNLGLLLNRRGERRRALVQLHAALRVARELGGLGQANILNNLGFTYSDLGETQTAINLHRQVLKLADATPPEKATALNNLGAIYSDLGNWEEAIQNYEEAIENLQKEHRLWRASTLNNLAVAQHSSGSFAAARTSYEQALALAGNNVDVQVKTAYSFGLLLNQRLGRSAEAVQQWKKVVQLAAEHPMLAHYGLAARAAIERGEHRLSDARETLREAVGHAEQRAELRFAADLTLRLARIEREIGDLPAAADHAREAVERIEALRNRVASLDQRALFLASSQTFYELYIRLLMDLDRQRRGAGYDARALTVSEQARARSLLDLLGEAESGLRRGVPPKILKAEQEARDRLRGLDSLHMRLIHDGAPPDQIAQAAERLGKAVNELEEVEDALRESSASYDALTRKSLNVRDLQKQVLGEETLLLEYSLGEERSYLWAVTPSTVQSFALPARRQIEAGALAFYNAITARDDAGSERAGRALSRMILGPVEPLLGDRTLLVVGDGVLQYVPFTALPLPSIPGQRVLARNRVVSLPSASALAALRRQIEGRPPAPRTLAALADPVFPDDPRLLRIEKVKKGPVQLSTRRGPPPRGPNDEEDQLRLPRLIFAAEEADKILALVSDPGQRLRAVGFDASYPLATRGKLAEFRYIHFATHGLLNNDQPKLSKLALSQYYEDGRPREESFLRLADIYNLELNADLVVLSACQTALGKEVRGEGLIGLTRGFMYAGAARVLASLWSVEDRATSELMKSFYRHLITDKLPAAEALRRAQLELAADPRYSSPYYWAGFSLQGEWK